MAATAGLIERVVEPEGEGDTALRAFQVIEVSATAKNFDDRLDTAFSRALLDGMRADRPVCRLGRQNGRARIIRAASRRSVSPASCATAAREG